MKLTHYLGILALAAVPGIASAQPITIKGSDTMVILVQRWAELYMQKNPDVQLQVTGGGSGTGISALINGTTDICMSSRIMRPQEKEKSRDRYSTPPGEVAVAKDGLSMYVHTSNPVEEISLEQVKLIYTGKITNWKELGGPDARIIPYSRENSSGTYVYFKEAVLNNVDLNPRAQPLPGTAAVVNAVRKEKYGIGYGGAAYAKGLKVLKLKKDASSPAVAVNEQTVKSGEYPLARPLYFYLKGKPAGQIKSFIDWIVSAEGQAIVTKVGYFPLD